MLENGDLCPHCERQTVKIVYSTDGKRIEFCRLCQAILSQTDTEHLFKTLEDDYPPDLHDDYFGSWRKIYHQLVDSGIITPKKSDEN